MTTRPGRPGRLRDAVRASSSVLLAAGLVVALAGCGAPAESVAAPEPTGLLDDYLAELAHGIDATAWGNAVAEAEAVIATCMAEAGFEYRPLAPPPGVYSFPAVLTPEYAAALGYGETTQSLGPDRPPMRFAQQDGDDPALAWNLGYVNGLSPEAQEAYRVAMHGPEPDGDDLAAIEAAAALGCSGRAGTEVYAHVQPPARLQAIQGELWDALLRIEADPRVAATLPAWADCMADAGYPGLTVPDDARNLVTELANAAALPADMSWAELSVAYAAPIAELQAAEVAIAVADTTCREEAGWYAARDEVEPEVEAQVLGDYRAELDALLEWMREHRDEER